MSKKEEYKLVSPVDKDWEFISELIAKSIPNTIISHLGQGFGKIFYQSLSQPLCSCVYVYKDNLNIVRGVVIGTTDHSASYSAVKENKYKLLLSMNVRIFKWTVIKWIVLNLLSKISNHKGNPHFSIKAELIAIAISPDMRGRGMAEALIRKMESFFIHKSTAEVYYILTEKENERANQFYRKIGAELVTTFVSRGREINRWQKKVNR